MRLAQALLKAAVALAALSVSVMSAAAAAPPAPMDTIVTFGDSLTQTWEEGSLNQRLAYAYCRKLDIVGRGFGGYNTEWALPILEQIVPKTPVQHAPRIRLMTIWFGANDACLAPSPQHLPIPKFQANLRSMVSHVREYSPLTKLLLLTPPPIHGPTRAALMAPQPLDRAQETTKAYAQAVLEVGETESVPVLDVFAAVERALGGDLEQAAGLFRDGLHLNRDGYQILYDAFENVVRAEFPELDKDALAPVYPLWADIDRTDIAKSVVPRPRDEL